MRALKIATRSSPLALWQANHVSAVLRQLHPGLEVSLVELTTEGDRFLSASLSAVGGKGLFVKEIEQALLDGRADIAVHSLKDMTSEMPPSLTLACVPVREDPRDAFVGRNAQFANLPQGARVGTSSLRRTCQLLERRPDLEIVPLRGNIQTRIRKIEELQLSGAVLAYAGLRRMGLADHVTDVIEPEQSLPAVGQGVLAIQCRESDQEVRSALSPLEHRDTRVAITAERAFLAKLEGGCTVPLAGYATLAGERLRMRGLVGRPDGKKVVRSEVEGPLSSAAQLGEGLAKALLDGGGREILAEFRAAQKKP